MTPTHTRAMQQKLAASFITIGSRVDELDLAFLTEDQKRKIHAANRLIKTCRGDLVRKRYQRARTALVSWRSRELMQVHAVAASWLRRREAEHAMHTCTCHMHMHMCMCMHMHTHTCHVSCT